MGLCSGVFPTSTCLLNAVHPWSSGSKGRGGENATLFSHRESVKSDKGVVHMTGLPGGKTLTSHLTVPPTPLPTSTVSTTHSQGQADLGLFFGGLGLAPNEPESNLMRCCLVSFHLVSARRSTMSLHMISLYLQ